MHALICALNVAFVPSVPALRSVAAAPRKKSEAISVLSVPMRRAPIVRAVKAAIMSFSYGARNAVCAPIALPLMINALSPTE